MTTTAHRTPQRKTPCIDPAQPLRDQPLSIEAELAATDVFKAGISRHPTSDGTDLLVIVQQHEQQLRSRLRRLRHTAPD